MKHNDSFNDNMIQHSKISEDTDDHDDDEYDDSDDDNDVDDNSNNTTTWKDELQSSWKQHVIAIIIAIIATFVSYYYHSRMNQASSSKGVTHNHNMAPTTLWQAQYDIQRQYKLQQHAHLDNYQRMYNVSFCTNANDNFNDNDYNENHNDGDLFTMDFTIPNNLLSTIVLHYFADLEQDDTYQIVMSRLLLGDTVSASSVVNNLPKNHPQYDCIHEQLQKQEEMQHQLSSYSDKKRYNTNKSMKGYTKYYKSPFIQSMYRNNDKDIVFSATNIQQQQLSLDGDTSKNIIEAAHLSFTGFGAKFVNMSPKSVYLYWDGRGGNTDQRVQLGIIDPYESISTATTPGQSFSVSPLHDYTIELDRWVVSPDEAVLYYYDPSTTTVLNTTQQHLYNMQLVNQEFAKQYQIHAKRTWLAQFPRPFPVHPMWDAQYFGQSHIVHHSTTMDGDNNIASSLSSYTLTVASVTPRVFTIPNFLSHEECDKLIELANAAGMKDSTVFGGGGGGEQQKQHNRQTRSSSNAWLGRDTANLTDVIYRRAAHILQIDESLLSGHTAPIDDTVHAQYHSMAESLQVIRYRKKEVYTPHHDWVIPSIRHRYQPTRYATILMYLNDDYEGGYTNFPRAVNSKYHDGIRIQPVKGQAILFYNMLPDGNVDDLSQHGSEPVTNGVKYAANLWVWEPMIN